MAGEQTGRILSTLPKSYHCRKKEILEKSSYYWKISALPNMVEKIKMTNFIIKERKNAKEDQEIISVKREFIVRKDCIITDDKEFVFNKKRIKDLKDGIEQVAVAMALTGKVIVNGMEDGFKFGVEIECPDNFEELNMNECNLKVALIYKERNVKYRALRSL